MMAFLIIAALTGELLAAAAVLAAGGGWLAAFLAAQGAGCLAMLAGAVLAAFPRPFRRTVSGLDDLRTTET